MNTPGAQELEAIIDKAMFNEMISVEQLHKIVTGTASNLMLLDIRCPEEQREGIIPGSFLFPNGHNLANRSDTSIFRRSFSDRFKPEQFNPDLRYILICRSGPRTEIALPAFLEHGFSACELIGGVLEWVRQGFALAPADASRIL
ncbi:MAG: hypothetical protein HQL73_12170 [Magnetococcales bacterium]|nr:hypothetical protein [Magnetococcales bacterium]